jgi:hypothetical protein
MRRTNWKTVSTLVTMALLSGCMDHSVSAPDLASGPVSMMLAPQGVPQLSLNGDQHDDNSVDFVVGSRGATILIGNNALVIPANSICDPATSSYGEGTWDSPCKALKTSIKMHAEVRLQDGRTWLDVSPHVRFVPSDNVSGQAFVVFYTPSAIGTKNLTQFKILYAGSIGGATTDLSARDATLHTYVDTRHGTVTGNVKHFSGYTVSDGFACETNCK